MAISFASRPALAELRICNPSPQPIKVAIGYHEEGDWMSEGWWRVNTDQCQTTIEGNLSSRYYYVFAQDEGSGKIWGGEYPFCIAPGGFAIASDGSCNQLGFQPAGFREIDVGQASQYTLELDWGR